MKTILIAILMLIILACLIGTFIISYLIYQMIKEYKDGESINNDVSDEIRQKLHDIIDKYVKNENYYGKFETIGVNDGYNICSLYVPIANGYHEKCINDLFNLWVEYKVGYDINDYFYFYSEQHTEHNEKIIIKRKVNNTIIEAKTKEQKRLHHEKLEAEALEE